MQHLLLIFFSFLSIKLCFTLYYYLRLALYQEPTQENQNRSHKMNISMIVCYHNERDNVAQSLQSLTSQSYPDIEFVLVDDKSEDNTLDLLRRFSNEKSLVVENHKSSNGKKMALALGIKEAKHDWLLVTDADCIADNDWVSTMVQHSGDKKIVLGFAPLLRSNTLIGKFARYETYYTALQYLSFALAGQPYMGVGRNMMYHRSIFDEAGGFDSHKDLASGDDDLLINYGAKPNNTGICIDPESFVYSPGKETLKAFIRQKTRHVSSSHRYKTLDKIILGISSLAQIGLYISAIMLLFSPWNYALVALLMYWILMMIIQYPICKKLHSMDLWLWFPIYDISMAMYYILMIPFTFIKKQNTWS